MNVIAGLSRYLLALDWTTNGTPVLTWPSDRNGANRRSRLGAAEAAVAVCWTRARFVGRDIRVER